MEQTKQTQNTVKDKDQKTIAPEIQTAFNEDAVLGKFLANKVWLSGPRAFDKNFPEQSAFVQEKASEIAEQAKEGAKTAGNVAGKALSTASNKALIVGLTAGILTARTAFRLFDWAVDWAWRTPVRKFQEWDPQSTAGKTTKHALGVFGENIAKGYKKYDKFFKDIEYPYSALTIPFTAAAAGGIAYWGISNTVALEHEIKNGHASAETFLKLAGYFTVGKVSNVVTLKPSFSLAKTTRDGFFDSDLYHQKVKPFYMDNIDPTVQGVKMTIKDVDNWVKENVPVFGDKEVNIREAAKKLADDISGRTAQANKTKDTDKPKTNSVPRAPVPRIPEPVLPEPLRSRYARSTAKVEPPANDVIQEKQTPTAQAVGMDIITPD